MGGICEKFGDLCVEPPPAAVSSPRVWVAAERGEETRGEEDVRARVVCGEGGRSGREGFGITCSCVGNCGCYL